MPALVNALETVIPDSSFRDDIRTAALEAWLKQPGANFQRAQHWLDGIRAGSIEDGRDELCAHLLTALYPTALNAAEVVSYLHAPKADHYIGWYRHFWSSLFFERTPAAEFALAADALVNLPIDPKRLRESFDQKRFVPRVIAAALHDAGLHATTERISRWLALGLDEYGSVCVDRDEAEPIRAWLSRHPDVQKRVIEHKMAEVPLDHGHSTYLYQQCTESLCGAERARDWYQWLLQVATSSEAEPLVEYCVVEAAMAVMRHDTAFDVALEDVDQWIDAHRDRWPQAEHWVRQPAGEQPSSSPWYWSTNDQRGTWHRRNVKRAAEQARERERRRAELAPHLAAIVAGTASPKLMQWIAMIHHGRVVDFDGETPQQRVASFLGGDFDEAQRAIDGLPKTLDRLDLPSVDEILQSDLGQKPVASACLLGATLACEGEESSPNRWSDDLVRRLVAFYLTDATHDDGWFLRLAQQRPQVVGEVMLAYVRRCLLQRRSNLSICGLWRLAREETLGDLARHVIPPLLQEFPEPARLWQVRHLNTELLPAARRHMHADDLRKMISQRLQSVALDSAQRIAWLLAGLRFAPYRRSGELVSLARPSRARRWRLTETVVAQTDHDTPLPDLPAAAWGRFIELFAPMARPEFPSGPGWAGPDHHPRLIVRGMIDRLAASTHSDAKDEIDRLREIPALAPWRTTLDAARFDHVRLSRVAHFEHAAIDRVARTLAGTAPANALDLAALTIQCLDDIESRIRCSEANDLETFWRDPAKGRRFPRIENQCRDRLFSLLQPMLQAQSAALNKESAHAGDKRADLRAEVAVDGALRVVPIEIKREDHRQVWSAWHDQLDGRYATHPSAEGVGIYLVLWFGHRPKPWRRGDAAPVSARQLESQLVALIPESDRMRLKVHVLDLSARPPAAKARQRGHRKSSM